MKMKGISMEIPRNNHGMEFNEKTNSYIKAVKDCGLNLYPLLGIFKKRSKLREPLPDEVVQAVCVEYLKRADKVDKSFPYFITVLKAKSHEYFANNQIREHEKMKKEPVRLKIRLD